MGYNVIFDHKNNRVGWARAKCEDTATNEIPCCGGPCRFGTTTRPSGTTTPIAAAVSTSSATTSSSATSTPWPILYTSTSSGTVVENASIPIFANSSQENGTTKTDSVHDPGKEHTATKGAPDWFSSMSIEMSLIIVLASLFVVVSSVICWWAYYCIIQSRCTWIKFSRYKKIQDTVGNSFDNSDSLDNSNSLD